MTSISNSLQTILNIAKIESILARRFDSGLGGVGFNEFIILFRLSQAENEKVRRIDLAEQIGLTASGVTRILLPMEKVGLVKRGTDERDARALQISHN